MSPSRDHRPVPAGPRTRCVGCGALVADFDGPTHPYLGASPGCWTIYGELHARAATDLAMGAVWPLAVDAYAVQHPGVPERRSSQSVWVHLVSLCLVLEHGWSPPDVIHAKQTLVAEQRNWSWLEPPTDPGRMTVLDVSAVADPGAMRSRIRPWPESVWAAWSTHAPEVRERTRRLLESR